MFKKSNKTVNIRTQIVSHSQKYKHGLYEGWRVLMRLSCSTQCYFRHFIANHCENVPAFNFFSLSVSSVAQSCLTLCNPMDCSMPGLPVHHQLLEFTQTMSIESMMPSNHLILCHPLLTHLHPFPASGSFQMSQFFASGGQRIGASTSVLPLNIHD